jgi:DNA polymerase I
VDTHLLARLIEPGETADHGLKALTERHIDSEAFRKLIS